MKHRTCDIWPKIIDQLQLGVSEHGHPFRLMTMATIDALGHPRQRMVVLREFDRDKMSIRLYTDARSTKVRDIQSHHHIGLLLYHPEDKIQLSISAIASKISDASATTLKDHSSDLNLNDYSTTKPPGTIITEIEEIEFGKHVFFTAIDCVIERIEYLQLNPIQHVKAVFKKQDDWAGQWIVP